MADVDDIDELIATRKLHGVDDSLYKESSTAIKEMQYQANRKLEVLATGYYFGLLYYILNLGTHPTAYIKIPESSKILKDKKNMYEIDIDVHGGITYAREYLYISNNKKIDGYFIGWDYAHYGDYGGYEEMLPLEFRTGGKKWSTQEILKEVKEACYQIAEAERSWVGMSNIKDIKFIEEMIKEYKTFGDLRNPDYEDTDRIYKALEYIIAEREQDKARIKELEEKNKKKSIECICYQEELENSILKQKVKDLIKDETINITGFECIPVEDIQELLEEK